MDNADSTADLNPSDPTLHLVQQRLLNRITHRIRQSLDLDAILTATVAEVQAFLKTDRVKIYQFQPDDHGLVIAEALGGDRLPSLRGLHFPADDIPAGARELYLRARQRTVVDLEAQKIGISDYPSLADTAAATTAELRYRPVDPCHVEYLRAMGVQSSVVVPIVTAGNPRQPLPSLGQEALLWGLLVSHHSEPRVVTEAELALIQAVVDQLTIAITQAELLKMAQQREQQAVKLNRVTQLLHQTAEVDLEAALAEVVKIFDGIGGRLYLSDRPVPSPWQNTQTLHRQIYTHGVQPEPLPGRGDRPIEENLIWQHYLTAMSVDWETKAAPADRVQMPWSVEWMRSNYGFTAIPQDSTDAADIDANGWATVDVYQEPLLRTLTPAIEATPIRGLLILPLQLGRAVVGCLTLFRASRSEEILWAGMCQPDQRQMAPRQSFEAWRQLKQGQAAPWTQAELTLGQAIAERFSAAAQQHHLYSQVQALNAHLEQQIQARTVELDKTLHLAQQQQTLASILGQLQRAWDIDSIFRTATQEVRQLLKVDRVAVYRFDEDWGGSFIRDFEAVSPVWSNLILATRATWNDDYLQAHQGGRYRHQE
ncbi:MAG: GAF domain-containing protein, partial [Cyanobacteria bacterium]|nr:GAF domain-containing protein [Cyanobacteriota bacterium]